MHLRSSAAARVNQRSIVCRPSISLARRSSTIRCCVNELKTCDTLELISDAGKQELKNFGLNLQTAKALAEIGYAEQGDLKYYTTDENDMNDILKVLQRIQARKVVVLGDIQSNPTESFGPFIDEIKNMSHESYSGRYATAAWALKLFATASEAGCAHVSAVAGPAFFRSFNSQSITDADQVVIQMKALQSRPIESDEFEGVSKGGKEELLSLGLNSNTIRELVHTMGYTLSGDIEHYLNINHIKSMKILPIQKRKLMAIAARPRGVDLLIEELRNEKLNPLALSALEMHSTEMYHFSHDFVTKAIPVLVACLARYAHSIGTNNLDHVKISLTYLIAFHESDEEDAYRAFDKEMERLTHSLQAILIGVDACIDKGDARLRTIKNQADQLLELLEELEE